MATIFISHSSDDNAAARAVHDWIIDASFQKPFVDLEGLLTGDKWEEELRRQINACRIVICLVTPSWLGSAECLGEFRAASYQHGKKIMPLLLGVGGELDDRRASQLRKVLRVDQALSLDSAVGADGGLDIATHPDTVSALKTALQAAGADPKAGLTPQAFRIDRDAIPEPFPGLFSFEDTPAHAAVFFGRSPETADCLEQLRAMRGSGRRKAFVIQGASGSGKSSLMKAGVLVRLRQEPAFIGLRAFRPGSDPLSNFGHSLEQTFAEHGASKASGDFIDGLQDAYAGAERDAQGRLTEAGLACIRGVLDTIADDLRQLTARDDATILVPVDQGEEVSRGSSDRADAFCGVLEAMTGGVDRRDFPEWQPILTVRSDSFRELQESPRFEAIPVAPYDLRPLRLIRFDDVIEGPAERYGVRIERGLVEAMTDDAPSTDALPLLAFAMQRLWRLYHKSGTITHAHYERLGKLGGIMRDAADRALAGLRPDEDVPRSDHKPVVLKLGERTFVPALADINEEQREIRRIASLDEFDDDQKSLLGFFDAWRLVVIRGDGQVEVTHEALFREWPLLSGWIAPQKRRLETLRGVKRDALVWEASGAKSDLAHSGRRLSDARRLRRLSSWKDRFGCREKRYLEACASKERRGNSRAFAASLAIIVGSGFFALNPQSVKKAYYRYVVALGQPATQTSKLEAGQAFVDCRIQYFCPPWLPELVVIPEGRFNMGSTNTTEHPLGDARYMERPIREVSVSRFAAGKFEVTFEEWDACVERSAQEGIGERLLEAIKTRDYTGVGCRRIDHDFGRGRMPMIKITWHDAKAYAAWLSEMTGQEYRLLSEAEWEYAARAMTNPNAKSTRFGWGDDDPVCGSGRKKNRAAFGGCQAPRALLMSEVIARLGTKYVGFSEPNAFGLYDMHGNVSEWVEDCYVDNYSGAPTDGSARTDRSAGTWAINCRRRVLRGGNWDSRTPDEIDSAYRGAAAPGRGWNGFGFRVARTL